MINDFESGNMGSIQVEENLVDMNSPDNFNDFIPVMPFNVEWFESENIPAGHYLIS
jgi:hypothetical protein